jgi:hypothetical protein
MKALTIKQPWATLIVAGVKDIENRSWHTDYRGTIGIHSSAKMTRIEMEEACEFMESFVPRFSAPRFRQEQFPTGVLLGTVHIVDCVRASDSPWFVGEYGFVLQDEVAFANPLPCRGALGFWDVPTDLATRAREEYRTALRQRNALRSAAG